MMNFLKEVSEEFVLSSFETILCIGKQSLSLCFPMILLFVGKKN